MVNSARRRIKVLVIGFCIGVLLFALASIPLLIPAFVTQSADAIRQENLVSSRGEDLSSIQTANVKITALLDNKPHEGIAVSADAFNWYMPQNAEIVLPLTLGMYNFSAVFENRQVFFSETIAAERDSSITLDISDAPDAPVYVITDIRKGEKQAFPLEITGADEVIPAVDMPNGVELTNIDNKWELLINGDVLRYSFYCIAFDIRNTVGQTEMIVGVRVMSDNNVIPIATAEELNAVRSNLSGNYRLTSDLNMSGIHNWVPIGSEEYPFSGTFDGSGFEITGFHAPEIITEGIHFSLLGVCKNAQIRNVIVREPQITPKVPPRDSGVYFGCAVVMGNISNSLIENCASIGGIISPSDGAVSGTISAANTSLVIGVFNSTRVICSMEKRYLPNTGGIAAGAYGSALITLCANEGEVKGNHLTSGIASLLNMSAVTRCINSGYTWGHTLVGEFPVGAIMQTTDYGRAYYGYFVKGQSAVGGKVFAPGAVSALVPIDVSMLRNPDLLPMLGSFSGEAPQWAYASVDANGPVPYGIFRKETPLPVLQISGSEVTLPIAEGISYFYSIDNGGNSGTGASSANHNGSNSAGNSDNGNSASNSGTGNYIRHDTDSGALSVKLNSGQTLSVYAAMRGCRDSETVVFSPMEG